MSTTETKDLTEPNEATYSPFLIVGVGASAGGVQALQEFFSHVKKDSGVAYVVILHLSPTYESQLPSILQTVTALPVLQVKEKVKVEVDHIYVVSPDLSLRMLDGHIVVHRVESVEERRAPIDIFFRTLAETHRESAVAVILSGSGADGSMGLKRIKENGGTVFVQSPKEAAYTDMPRNAIATNLVDEVMNACDIPERILGFKERIGTLPIPVSRESQQEEQQGALREIFNQLRINTGHDFTNYKRATVLRRIERRIYVREMSSLTEYADVLKAIPGETQALLKDLLISVTNFFRDKDYFTDLEENVIPRILHNHRQDIPVRVWVAGCATGEEAYSVAMLFSEYMNKSSSFPAIQIFATDIDTTAITHAREGLYTLNDAADVAPDRLRRFFIPEAGGFRIIRELRDMVLFASHNVLKDPPFSRLDMITCRNMLIYFNQVAQNRVMETFHFALNPGGFLFIGSSESIDGANDLFVPVSKHHQIYQSREATNRPLLQPDPLQLPAFRTKTGSGIETMIGKPMQEVNSGRTERISLGNLHQRLLEQYAPPSILVNETHEIVHISEHAGRYLQIPGGEKTNDILKLIRGELRLELRSALFSSVQNVNNVEVKNLSVQTGNHVENINLLVRPVLNPMDTARGFILIIFEPSLDQKPSDALELSPVKEESLSIQLEQELINLKIQLRASNEQYEIQTEELKASNEEHQAVNEELRSVAEELETSKEELQSMNEELVTVNHELKAKIEELSQTNVDFQNLINSLEIGTIFLDRYFRVKLFTPAAREIFNLIAADIGRPLADITSQINYKDVQTDAETVLLKLQTVEREVTTRGGRVYLMQMQPYRTADDHISGVVIAFINITQRKQAEYNVYDSEERLRLAVEAGHIGTCDWNYPTDTIKWNDVRFRIHGMEPHNRKVKLNEFYAGIHPKDLHNIQVNLPAALENEGKFTCEYRVIHPDDSIHWIVETSLVVEWQGVSPLRVISVAFDTTGQRHAKDKIQESEEKYHALFHQNMAGMTEMDPEGNFTLANQLFCDSLGYAEGELLRMNVRDVTHAEDFPKCEELLKLVVENEQASFTNEKRLIRKDGDIIWIAESISAVRYKTDEPASIVAVGINVTLRKKAEIALHENQERYRIALDAGELATWDWNILTNKIVWNEQHFRLFGVDREEATIEPAYFLSFIYPEDIPLVNSELEHVLGERGVYSAEFRIKREDNGALRWMSGYGRVTERDKEGKAIRVSGVMFDTTDRKEAEEKLKATQNRLTMALEATEMGVWTMDLTNGSVNRNPRHDQLLGFVAWQETWNTEKAKTNIIEEDKAKFDAAYSNLISKGVFELEARVQQLDNEICWIRYYGRTFESENGKDNQAAGVIFDITGRKTMEKQKDEFIGVASHELRTPVTSIKAYVGILEEMFTEKSDLQAAGLMNKLDKQVDRLMRLIKDLLDVTKVSEGQLDLTLKSFSITDMAMNVVEEMQRTSSRQRIVLTVDTLPEVVGDEERLGQVLTNLISNAIKYSSESKDVLVNAKYEDNKIIFSVQDFGIGMSTSTLEKLFSRFFRSDNPSVRSYPGLGLGLFISMEIMKRHGGMITVASEKGKGSVFTMVLPLV